MRLFNSFQSAANYRFIMSIGALSMLCMQAQGQNTTSLRVADGVVYSADSSQLVSANALGDLQAHSATSGALQWRSELRAWPLFTANGSVIALVPAQSQKQDASLVQVDLANGEVLQQSELSFPDNVLADWQTSPARTFTASWQHGDEATVGQLHWEFFAQPVRGALLQEDLDATSVVSTKGGFNVAINADGFAVSNLSTRALAEFKPFQADYAAVEQLAELATPQFRSAKSDAVMLSQAQNDSTFGTSYNWQIYSRQGARIGGMKLPISYAPYAIVNERALVQLPPYAYLDARGTGVAKARRVAAFDLSSQRELWSFDVYDTQYRGVLPP